MLNVRRVRATAKIGRYLALIWLDESDCPIPGLT